MPKEKPPQDPSLDYVFMMQISNTVQYRCPRCNYIMHASPGETIPCPACYGRGYFTKKDEPRPEPGCGTIIPFNRPGGETS